MVIIVEWFFVGYFGNIFCWMEIVVVKEVCINCFCKSGIDFVFVVV